MICIYAIINIITDHFYIGQTEDRDCRWAEHRKQLRGFYHHSLYLQRAWCKYSEDKFIFVVLESFNDTHKLNERENHWFEKLKPEYNVAPAGSMRGYKHTDEARENMRKAHLGKKHHSEEEKQRRRERMKGNKFAAGRKHTPEQIEARASVIRGKPKSEDHKAKLSAAQIGKFVSAETRNKQSIAAKLRRQRELTN